MPEQMSSEAWMEAEKHVSEAEAAKRKAKAASEKLYKKTGVTKAGRAGMEKEEILEKARSKRVAEKALEREEQFETEAQEILGDPASPENLLVELQKENLVKALRENRGLENSLDAIYGEEMEVLAGVETQPGGEELEALGEIREEINKLEKQQEELKQSNPEAYFGLNLAELKEYHKQLEKGKIIETKYVKDIAEEALARIRAGKPIFPYGHLGSGKTEFAMHIVQKYIGKEALIISGSKYTSMAELYGHQVLAIDQIKSEKIDEYTREVEEKYANWLKEHPDMSEGDKNRVHDTILQTYLTQFKGGTVSDFYMGPIYRAMEEGRPVIIDEVNAIPHAVLISLNHILTRKVGDTINVQQDSGRTVKIKEGFGIIMTGNLNQGQDKYVDRPDMDPAFLSRLYKIEYDYLPQETEGTLEEQAGKNNELFEILLAKVIDKNGNAEMPEDSLRKLWKLAQAAKIIQDVFSGKEVGKAYYFQEAGGRATQYFLKESVLSIRALNDVMTQWQKEGYKNELDYYLWKEFVSQSTVASDKAYLYQTLKDRFGFFQSEGWKQDPDYGKGGKIDHFDIAAPQNPAAKVEFFGPREVVEAAFGKAPERAQWPELKVALSQEEQNVERLMKREKIKDGIIGKIPKEAAEIIKEI